VLLLSDGGSGARGRIYRLLGRQREGRALRKLAEMARREGVVEKGLEVAASLVEEAKEHLATLPDSLGRRMLEFLADSVVARGRMLLQPSRG